MKELRGAASASVAAPVERCVQFLGTVDRYPEWYGEVVRSVEVLDPGRARATLHVSVGPLTRDIRLLLSVAVSERSVVLRRIPHEPTDPERFEVSWSVFDGPPTRVGLELSANLDVPRLVPLGGVGEAMARGFVVAAARELGAA